MTALGLVFSNIHDQNIPELTRMRTMASAPIGCRYRLIDFVLSNMVNSGITKVGVITHNNYQSLLDHIGTGKDWDLARRSGGIKILPPYITSFDSTAANKLYTSRIEALAGALHFLDRSNEDYVVLSDCDSIININLADILHFHEEKGADMTIVTKKINVDETEIRQRSGIVTVNDEGRITEVVTSNARTSGIQNVSTNIIVSTRTYLIFMIQDALAHGISGSYNDLIDRNMFRANFFAYEYDGYFDQISSLPDYFAANMKLLDADVRHAIFGAENRPVYTKVRNSAPTRYTSNAKVVNSLIADGCVIDGTVENSIIFRGVKIGRGSVVRNCILMQDTVVGENTELNCVVSDKNVLVKDDRKLSGHESMPFFISKGKSI